MSVPVSYLAAFGGGVLSFASPCVLPVVPAYLSVVTGLDLAGPADGRGHLARIVRDGLLFVAGFGTVFVLLGVSATSVGQALFHDRLVLTRAAGAFVIAMALFLAGSLVLRLPALYGEVRFHPDTARLGPLAAPVAGVAFGLGWTPCIGPVLASVLSVAATERGIGRGALLLACYAAGLGVPLLAVGCGLGRLAGALAVVRRHLRAVTIASALLLAGFGVLLVLDRMSWATSELEVALRAIGLGRLVTIG
ncbi:MAG TPA: cytochrome c biogenesis protein CcdA [Acidimicrobiales bacterium]|jgi:cytochrome c-type biogenesis protein|nr:cytochrome c biogenesis protein CcdA [Acidimicrobiales bacterium]